MRCSVALTAAHRSCRLSMTRMKPTPDAAMLPEQKQLLLVGNHFCMCLSVCACVHVFDYFGKTTELFIEPRPDYSVSDFVEVGKYIKYGHFCKVIDIPVL